MSYGVIFKWNKNRHMQRQHCIFHGFDKKRPNWVQCSEKLQLENGAKKDQWKESYLENAFSNFPGQYTRAFYFYFNGFRTFQYSFMQQRSISNSKHASCIDEVDLCNMRQKRQIAILNSKRAAGWKVKVSCYLYTVDSIGCKVPNCHWFKNSLLWVLS